MAVAFDAKTASWKQANPAAATLTITNLTIGAGSNRGLLCGVFFENGAIPAGITANWDSAGTPQAMTQITNAVISADGTNSCTGAMYGLLAPTSGNKNLQVSWTGNNVAYAFAISFTGVDQTSVAVAFPHGNSAHTSSTSPATVTITSATGNQVVAMFANGFSAWGASSGTSIATDVTGPNQGVAANYNNGAASVTATYAFTGTGLWDAIGCDVLAAGGAAFIAKNNIIQQAVIRAAYI